MSDTIRPLDIDQLYSWLVEEHHHQQSIFGIHTSCFFKKINTNKLIVAGENLETPIGPAAGPHTQLCQNILAAFLTGGRFFELKTVQKLDCLDIEKPCIDASDEAYNTEWSTELSLEQAYDEYCKAWLLCHVLETALDLRLSSIRSFQYNMSIGYDLEGIKTERMDRFINSMSDASCDPVYKNNLELLRSTIRNMKEIHSPFFHKKQELLKTLDHVSTRISPSVTLSTMHGCPPQDIQAIAEYLLQDKQLNTSVKLNPTLLGYTTVRNILDSLGYSYVRLAESSFKNDLQYDDAIDILKNLMEVAKKTSRDFGVKLSNTLGVLNRSGKLPSEEMYLSGRALYPLTIQLTAKLAADFDGRLPISYCGGLNQQNIIDLFNSGIKPLTLVTDLLKPGGYYRLGACAVAVEAQLEGWSKNGKIDIEKLEDLAEKALKTSSYRKNWRGTHRVQLHRDLPLFDCYISPCSASCPINQDIPEYIRLIGRGRCDEALELIYRKNPLPHITGWICDHQCMFDCSRRDYDGPVLIRDLKRIATEQGMPTFRRHWLGPKVIADNKVAVIGAGPAGLSCAFFLARVGMKVTIFEKQKTAGGIVRHVLPHFRLPQSVIEKDISFIEDHGVEFRFDVQSDFSIDVLKKQNYKYIFISIGAEKTHSLEIEGDSFLHYNALDFLKMFNKNPSELKIGKHIAVVGGGNTAMDSARAALRIQGVETVTIVYRRTQQEMPADREEFDNAIKDGVIFLPLATPECYSNDSGLVCRKMKLGTPDSSGRPRPEPSGVTMNIPVDCVVSAVGEKVDVGLLERAGIPVNKHGRPLFNAVTHETALSNVFIGGDAFRGPATVVKAIADARQVADIIISRENLVDTVLQKKSPIMEQSDEYCRRIILKKGKLVPPVLALKSLDLAKREAERCLECNLICNKCVDVCPNRANVVVHILNKSLFHDVSQVIHLDYLCNECGNCDTFCPYKGAPYKDKLTIFYNRDDFYHSSNNGFYMTRILDQDHYHFRLSNHLFMIIYKASNGWLFPEHNVLDSSLLDKIIQILDTLSKNYSYLIPLNKK